ncbi:hypothetical protein CDAR_96551 [Caerostris darwini]|uniref:Uncharacterized protein n=1 Tax=Caerostris darwini TaxID=1538125 RepID=A0AAV4QUV8_9ARAC|nr:hypothetical protein CDAR_96551 [Caerostris darwini]
MSCADALSLSASPPPTYLGVRGWWGCSNPAEDIYFISFRSPLTSAFTSSLAGGRRFVNLSTPCTLNPQVVDGNVSNKTGPQCLSH